MKRIVTKATSTLLVLLMIVGMVLTMPTNVKAAAKPRLNVTKLILFYNPKYDDNPSVRNQEAYLNVVNATAKASWSSTNKKVATVSQHGTVTTVNKGKCVIKCKIGKTVLKCNVTVLPEIASDTLAKKIKMSTKNVGNCVEITIKNKNKYPLSVSFDVRQYDVNGKKLTFNTSRKGVGAESSVKYYINKAENYGYTDIEINDCLLGGTLNSMIATDKVTFKSAGFADFSKENSSIGSIRPSFEITKKIPFNTECGYQILVYDNYNKLIKVANYAVDLENSTGIYSCDMYLKDIDDEFPMVYGKEKCDAIIEEANNKYTYKANVTGVYVQMEKND